MIEQDNFDRRLNRAIAEAEALKRVQSTDYRSIESRSSTSSSQYDFAITAPGNSGHHIYTMTITPASGRLSSMEFKILYRINNPDVLGDPVFGVGSSPASSVLYLSQPMSGNNYVYKIDVFNGIADPSNYTTYVKFIINGTDDFTWSIV